MPIPAAIPDLQPIERAGRHFLVAGTHLDFWRSFAAGSWEPETFAIFDHYLDSSTVHLDVGSWIGPTILYAATRARQVIGFEPDPVAFRILEINVRANPGLAPIQVHPVAIAARPGRLALGSRTEAGDSMSSALFADGPVAWTAPARRLEEFEATWPADAPVFLKIDIEGGEYDLLPSLAAFVRRRRPTLYLSLHSHFFLGRSTSRGVGPKAWQELRLLKRFIGFWPVIRQFPHCYSHSGRRISRLRLFHRSTWRRTYALVLAHRPMPPPSSPSAR